MSRPDEEQLLIRCCCWLCDRQHVLRNTVSVWLMMGWLLYYLLTVALGETDCDLGDMTGLSIKYTKMEQSVLMAGGEQVTCRTYSNVFDTLLCCRPTENILLYLSAVALFILFYIVHCWNLLGFQFFSIYLYTLLIPINTDTKVETSNWGECFGSVLYLVTPQLQDLTLTWDHWVGGIEPPTICMVDWQSSK